MVDEAHRSITDSYYNVYNAANRTEDEIFDRADIFGVMSFRVECIGEGVYDARKALSVPSLMPNLEVANLCAAGDMVDTLVDKLATDLGVLILERAC